MPAGSARHHEAGLHRRPPSRDQSNLDADQYQEFHRRYNLDEGGDMTHYSEAYFNRMDGMELDRMKVILIILLNLPATPIWNIEIHESNMNPEEGKGGMPKTIKIRALNISPELATHRTLIYVYI